MPEGPEVKIITEQLAKEIEGKYLRGIWISGGRFLKENVKGLDAIKFPKKIDEVSCKGKFIYWALDNWSLWNTLGMTGEWSIGNRGTHPGLKFWISNDSTSKEGFDIFFNDIRHFGTVSLVQGSDKLIEKLNSLGPDMLSALPSIPVFAQLIISQGNNSIVSALMNQKVISGVGNYIKSEALYRAAISPWRKCKDISLTEIPALRQSIIDVMQESYDAGGATLATYKNALGKAGNFGDQLKVYGKKLCPFGTAVISEQTEDKRTSWWVPSRQK